MKTPNTLTLSEYIALHKNLSNSEIADNLRRRGIRTADVAAARTGAATPIQQRKPARRIAGMSRNQFAAKYDNDTRIRVAIQAGVATLTDPDEILEDQEFRSSRCANIHINHFRQIAEEPEFTKYQFRKGSRVFWANPATVKWAIETVEGTTTL